MRYSIVALEKGRALRAGLGLWLVAVLGAGCVAEKSLGVGQSCPCAPGWSCNESLQLCVEAGDADPGADAGHPEAGADGVEVDGLTLPRDAADDNAGCSEVSYPAAGFYGRNVFALDATSFISELLVFPIYEAAADLAPGATVTVKITLLPDTLARFQAARADGGFGGPVWYYSDGEGWLVSFFDEARGEQVFQSQNGVRRPEKRLSFGDTGQARVDYFECGSTTPTRTKTISWAPDRDAGSAPPPGDAPTDGQ